LPACLAADCFGLREKQFALSAAHQVKNVDVLR
jgi:hypothetical protein